MDELKTISIYAITDHLGGTRYIGMTSRSARLRFLEHVSEARCGHECRRCNWIRKELHEGREIGFRVIERTTPVLCEERERFWIALSRHAGIQITNIAGGGRGYDGLRTLPRTKEWNDKLRLVHLGRKRSDESRRRISEAHKGIRHSEATKALMSLRKKGVPKTEAAKIASRRSSPFCRPIFQMTADGQIAKRFEAVGDAAKALSSHKQLIALACRFPHRTAAGYHWKYCDPPTRIKVGLSWCKVVPQPSPTPRS